MKPTWPMLAILAGGLLPSCDHTPVEELLEPAGRILTPLPPEPPKPPPKPAWPKRVEFASEPWWSLIEEFASLDVQLVFLRSELERTRVILDAVRERILAEPLEPWGWALRRREQELRDCTESLEARIERIEARCERIKAHIDPWGSEREIPLEHVRLTPERPRPDESNHGASTMNDVPLSKLDISEPLAARMAQLLKVHNARDLALTLYLDDNHELIADALSLDVEEVRSLAERARALFSDEEFETLAAEARRVGGIPPGVVTPPRIEEDGS